MARQCTGARELHRAAVILSPGVTLRAPLSEICREASGPAGSSTLEHVEREHVIRVLRETGGVVTGRLRVSASPVLRSML
jgi:hypothetical protein